MLKQLEWNNLGINVNGQILNNLRFGDDIVLITDRVDHANIIFAILKSSSPLPSGLTSTLQRPNTI